MQPSETIVASVDLTGLSTNAQITNTVITEQSIVATAIITGPAGTAASNLVTSVAGKQGVITLNKGDVGLDNVDDTSDVNKPISSLTQAALNTKENLANKSIAGGLGTSDSLYPTQNAVKTYFDTAGTYGLTTNNTTVMTTLRGYIPTTLGTGTSQNYRSPTAAEVRDITKGLQLIAQEAGKPYASIDITNAVAILSPYGFTVTKSYDSSSLRPYVLAQAEATYPLSSNYRAWGNYWFDLSRPVSTIIEAPHPQTDGNSENIALRTWQNTPGALYIMSSVNRKAKDYMVTEVSTDHTGGTYTLDVLGLGTTTTLAPNASIATIQTAVEAVVGVGNVTVTGDPANTSLHAFINLNPTLYNSGNPTNTITIGTNSLTGGTFLTLDHDADAAHNYNSLFSNVISAFALQGYAQLQLHGFSDVSSGIPRIFGAILSRGSSNNTKLIEATRTALEAQGFDVATKDSFSTQGLYVTGGPTGGTITLTYNAIATSAIAYSATPATFAASVQAALEAHPSIGTGNVAVTLSQNNNTGVSAALVITFNGTLYHQGLTAITVSNNSLTGGTSPTASGLTAEGTALTAASNTQGDIADAAGTVFMHLELSDTVRNSTSLSARAVAALSNVNLPQLSAAVMPVLAESGHSTSQAPLVNGSGATIGTSPVAARGDHRHPMTNNTPSAGDYVRRSDANASWIAVSSSQIRTDLGIPTVVPDDTLVMHLAGAETATGLKTFQTDTSGNGPQVLRSSSTAGQQAKLGFRVSATPNNTSNMASVTALRTDAPSSQDTALVFSNRRGGSAESEVGRFDTAGNLQVFALKAVNAALTHSLTISQDGTKVSFINTVGTVDWTLPGDFKLIGNGVNPKLRIGNNGFSKSVDVYHDGTDSHVGNVGAGSIKLDNDTVVTGNVTPEATGTRSLGLSSLRFASGFINSISTNYAAKTSAYSVVATDSTLTGDATSGAFNITLLTAVGNTGRIFTIKKTDASGNAVTVATTSSQTIDGSTTYVLSTQYKYVTVQSNGANWIIIGNN